MQTDDPKTTTRGALIDAGLHLFGRQGYEGTSTRELAERAGTNIASINYHFGGKGGLRSACATSVANRISAVLDTAAIMQVQTTPQAAETQIEHLASAFIDLVVGSPQARDMVAFMLREITDPGEISQQVYETVVEPRHRALCALWAAATGRTPEDDAVKLSVFALIGQVVYFRIASDFVMRRMSWDQIGPAQTGEIKHIVIANLRDAIERQRL